MASSRGRKSAAALSVVPARPYERPAPPDELTEEQAEEWQSVVGRMPPEWFTRETHALLVQFCRHVVKARVMAATINGFDRERLETPEGVEVYDRLTKMAEREGRAISSLATRMRLTQHSRYNERVANTKSEKAGAGAQPWKRSAG